MSNAEAKYFFENWPTVDGIEISSVTAITQSPDGYLWIATYDGLLRFDGLHFRVFNSSNTEGLRTSRLTTLFTDHAGRLWIGHETGDLSQYSEGGFRSVPLGFHWVGGPIVAINMDSDGEVWLASDRGGVFRLRDGHCALQHLVNKGWPASMFHDRDDALWVFSNGGAGVLNHGIYRPQQIFGDLETTNIYGRGLPAADGSIWVQRNGSLGKWRDGKWEQPFCNEPWTNDYDTAYAETPDGSLVAGTMRHGLFIFHPGGSITHYTRADGLPSDSIRCLFVDREKNIWIGTADGFSALRPLRVETLKPPDAFDGHKVLAIEARRPGSIWVGTEGAGLYHFQYGPETVRWTRFSPANGFPSSFVWTILEGADGGLLVGTWGNGLLMQSNSVFLCPDPFTNAAGGVLALHESSDGRLWVGTTTGIYAYESGKLVWSAGKERLPVPDVRAITETADGAVWFGTCGGGLGRISGQELSLYSRSNGLGSDFVQCLLADTDGSLWIGASDQGLCRWKGGKFSTLGPAHGFPPGSISHILDDHLGNLWFGTQHGILRASKLELNLCADGAAHTARFMQYDKAEGLGSESCSGGFQSGACRCPDGRLLFSTSKGVAVVDPSEVRANQLAPPVIIETFMVGGKPVDIQESHPGAKEARAGPRVQVPPGNDRFEFTYTAPSLRAPERIRFKYRLEGLEEDWVDAGAKRVAEYSYLRPGSYVFHVIACNNDGVWNEVGDSLAFFVQPHFWQTLWFQVAALIAGAALIGGLARAITRRKVRAEMERLERQQAIEKERARIARDIHDDLGASLTRITMLSEAMRKDFEGHSDGAIAAQRVNSTARELTRALDEIVWAVNPRHDTLDSLATYLGGFAQDFLKTSGIRCRLDMPVHLPALELTSEIRHNVFLTLKEALHNVVRHSQATEVEVSLELLTAGFAFVVADNGRGFPALPSNGSSPPNCRPGGGSGLRNMQKRLEDIGGRCEWESKPGQGTRVRLILTTMTPIQGSFS